jgi:hypothetical protein
MPALKDNATTDIAALHAQHNAGQAARKKSRGKSIGPGGLEALNETTANIVKVGANFVSTVFALLTMARTRHRYTLNRS